MSAPLAPETACLSSSLTGPKRGGASSSQSAPSRETTPEDVRAYEARMASVRALAARMTAAQIKAQTDADRSLSGPFGALRAKANAKRSALPFAIPLALLAALAAAAIATGV